MIIFITTDFSELVVSNSIDVLQKKIDEITKRRRITFLRKTLRKIKIDEKIEFRISVMFDETLTLLMRSKNNAKLNREKLYRMINSKKYSRKNQQNFENFLRKCVILYQIKFFVYKKKFNSRNICTRLFIRLFDEKMIYTI